MKQSLTAGFLCLILFAFTPLWASSLDVPPEAGSIRRDIQNLCPSCLENGLVPTGSDKIGYGRDFFPHFFPGKQPTGMLLTFVMSGSEYTNILRTHHRTSAMDILRSRFSSARLIVVEKDGYRVHVSGKPTNTEVTVTPQLHECLRGSAKPLCCCCTRDCSRECCEKKLGSTKVTLTWPSPLNKGTQWIYSYSPHPGGSLLYTVDSKGRKKNVRWCLDSGGPGYLKE